MNLQTQIDADLRRTLIQLLAYDVDYSLNDNLLYSAVEGLGKTLTRDQLANHLGWLTEQNLISTRKIASMTIATLTDRGLDVAKGKVRIHGVRDLRPSELHEIGQDNLLG